MQLAVDDDSDAALRQRVVDGEQAAFAGLMRRYNRRLYRVARSILRDDAEAEDALQDAYIQAYRALPDFRGESSLATWLTRIVMNAALMRRRSSGRMAEVIELGAEPAMEQYGDAGTGTGDTAGQPEQAAQRAQARGLIEAKIDGLPEVFRTVFILRAVEELSVEETGKLLDIPEATVRSRYFRARGMLREALARELDFALDDAFGFDGARCDRIVEGVMRRLDEEKAG
ncbi:RNA polymerase sigma factor [Massilia sp. LXY-6]|uniref:RNA polymerase sigma factor n=1 Tax=Massilia sp. LXY-6 TaxID=3379823 RepID=UPI003EE12DCC